MAAMALLAAQAPDAAVHNATGDGRVAVRGRTALVATPEDLHAVFGLDAVPEVIPRYNVPPSQPVAAVRVLRGSPPGVSASKRSNASSVKPGSTPPYSPRGITL